MTFSLEDTTAYIDTSTGGYATSGTLAGVALSGIFNQSTLDADTGMVNTREQSFIFVAQDAPAAAVGQAFVHAAITYTVRRVESMPPDGVFASLVLARVT